MDPYLIKDAAYVRLRNEYDKFGSITVGLDFDGTVYDYHGLGHSHEQVRQLVRDLKSINCTICVWTANKDLEFVERFMKENNIPFDSINAGGIPLPWESKKPFFSILLDDRAGLAQTFYELTTLVNYVRYINQEPITII